MLPEFDLKQRRSKAKNSPERLARWDALKHAPTTLLMNSFTEGVVYGGKGGYDGGLCAKNQLAQGGFAETGRLRGGKLGFGPAAFGAYGEDGLLARWLGLQNLANASGVRAL